MEIDRKLLNQAIEAEPEKLQELARQIAAAMGVPEERALALARNAPLLQAKLSSMSDGDLATAAQLLGPERAAQIMALLRGDNG